MYFKSCTPVDPKRTVGALSTVRTYEFAFDIDRQKTSIDPPSNLGELFVLSSCSWKKSGSCIGLIASNEMNSTFLQDQKLVEENNSSQFKVWLCVSSNTYENTGWLAESDLPPKMPNGVIKPQTMHAMNVGTVTTSMREYESLISIDYLKSHLKELIFGDKLPTKTTQDTIKKELISDTSQLKKPSSIQTNIWDHLSSSLNYYQMSAIEKLLSGKMKDNVMLIQGPPGKK